MRLTKRGSGQRALRISSRVIVAAAMIATTAAVVGSAGPAHAATTTLTVDSLAHAVGDWNVPGQKTLYAALTEANSMAASPGDDITIEFDSTLAGNIEVTTGAEINTRMFTGSIGVRPDVLGVGAFYQVDANNPVTIDFGGDIGIEHTTDHGYSALLIDSDDVTVTGFTQVRSGEAGIVVGKDVDGATISDGTMDDSGTINLEVGIGVATGVTDLTISDVTIVSPFRHGVFFDENAKVDGVNIDQLDVSETVEYSDIMLWTGAEVSNLTVSNSHFNSPGAVGNITFGVNSKLTDASVDNSTFTGQNGRAHFFNYGGARTTNLKVENSTFTNGRFVWEDLGGVLHTGLTFEGNTFEEMRSHVLDFNNAQYKGTRVVNNDFRNIYNAGDATIWVGLDAGNYHGLGGDNVIQGNRFIQQPAFLTTNPSAANKWAIFNDARSTKDTRTGWSIIENHVEGYFGLPGAPIANVDIGITPTWGNTFGPGTRGSMDRAQTEVGGSWFVWNETGLANHKIQTWRVKGTPTYAGSNVTVTAEPVTPLPGNYVPTNPVEIHAYWTADDKAEIYLGKFPAPISVEDTYTFTGVDPAVVSTGKVRLQTVDVDGNSSQYSGEGDAIPNAPAIDAPADCRDSWVETFGNGTGWGPALAPGLTTYIYQGDGGNHITNDGEYSIVSDATIAAPSWAATGGDATGDPNGQFMLVNAAAAAGTFYKRDVNGLEVGKKYRLSAMITNAGKNRSPILPNVTLRVIDPSNNSVIAKVSTGNIVESGGTLGWKEYGLEFDATVANARLEVVNNGPGGSGNDLALDDIKLAMVCPAGLVGPLVDCTKSIEFATSNEGWLNRSTKTGFDINKDYGQATWASGEGQPPGAVRIDDADGQWQELVSPVLTSGSDHSFMVGETLTFDYKNNLGVDTNLYVALEGNNGKRYFYIFKNQVTAANAWNQISVPLTAAQWRTGFANATGPTGAAPSDAEFAAVLADLKHLAISMEGQTGPDITYVDNFALDCAPDVSSLELTKTAKLADIAANNDNGDVGEVITYTFVVTNTGNLPVTDVKINDDFLGLGTITPASVATLAAGASATFTADYTIVLADVNAQGVTNTATAEGTSSSGGTVTSPADTEKLPIVITPSLDLVKSSALTDDVNGNTLVDAGDELTYTFKVTNTGNSTATDVEVSDPMTDLSAITPATVAKLAPGDTATFTATYTVKQADVNAGQIVNSATADGQDPTGDPITSPAAGNTVTIASDAKLDLVKTVKLADADGNSNGDVGELLTYTFVVTNSGNVALTGVTVNDAGLPGLSPLAPAGAVTLAPGESATFTATYTLTLADVNAQGVTNTATAVGTPPTGAAVTGVDTEKLPIEIKPKLELVKSSVLSGDLNGNGTPDVGDLITYTFEVENTGNSTITDLTVADPKPGLTAITPASVVKLDPGAKATFTAMYTVTQSDVNDGEVKNTAKAEGTDATNTVVESNPDTETVAIPRVSELVLDKTSALTDDVNSNGKVDVGDVLTYTFKVTNGGNATVTDLKVDDPMPGLSATMPPMRPSLAPGATTSFTATYMVTQADMNSGKVENTATAEGEDPTGAAVVSSPDTVTVPLTRIALMDLAKAGNLTTDANNNGLPDAGDVLTYTFTVTNTGNVTMTGVTVQDAKAGLSAIAPASVATLAPGSSASFTATYMVTPTDVAAGKVQNTATAAAKVPGGNVASNPASATVPTAGAPDPDPVSKLGMVKAAALTTDVNSNGLADADDVITYTFTATNSGTVALTDVTVTDPKAGLSAITPVSVASLAPGNTATFTATYTVKQADVNGGEIVNTATAGAKGPQGAPVTTAPSTARVPTFEAKPGLKIDKRDDLQDSNGNNAADLGETVNYTFVVTNTGNTTLTGIAVTDDRVTGLTPSGFTLAPGDSKTVTSAPYTVTAADVAAGKLVNVATAGGTATGGAAVTSAPDQVITPVAPVTSTKKTTPRLKTKASAKKVGLRGADGSAKLFDTVTLKGFRAGSNAKGTAVLYGPTATRTSNMCVTGNKVGTVKFNPRNGTFKTPKVKVTKPGHYTWVVSVSGDKLNNAVSHACGLKSESTLVHRAAYGPVVIGTGFGEDWYDSLLRRAVPNRFAFAALGINASVASVGVRNGEMAVPDSPAQLGWLNKSAALDDVIGTSIVAGHVSDNHDRPGAFWKLKNAKAGQVVTITDNKGKVHRYKVTKKAKYLRSKPLPKSLFKTTGAHRLLLVTCTDKVTYRNGSFHYTKNLVVSAKRLK